MQAYRPGCSVPEQTRLKEVVEDGRFQGKDPDVSIGMIAREEGHSRCGKANHFLVHKRVLW